MSTTTDEAAPRLTAEEIGERFLSLIQGLDAQESLTLQRVKDATGLPLEKSLHGNFFGFVSELGDGWEYALNFYPESPSNKNAVSLSFTLGSERFPDMAPVCQLDFLHYNNALKEMGYRDVRIAGEEGQLEAFRYYKSDIVISIIPEVRYFGSDKQARPTCIRSISTYN